MPFAPEERNSQEGPVGFHQEECKSQDEELCFAPEGGNSPADQVHFESVHFTPLHLAPEGGNSSDN